MQLVRRRGTRSILRWLVLATIFAHALLPVGSPLVRTSGSAFSATTAEVSLAPSRKGKAAVAKREQQPSSDEPSDGGGGIDLLAGHAQHLADLTDVCGADHSLAPNIRHCAAFRRPFQARAPPLS